MVKEWFSRKRQLIFWIHDFGILLIEIDNENKQLDTYWLCEKYNKKKIYILFNIIPSPAAMLHFSALAFLGAKNIPKYHIFRLYTLATLSESAVL